MSHTPEHKPRVGSIGTNASGLTTVSLGLSQFPTPPDNIPSIALRLDPNAPYYYSPGTPTRSSPVTPTRENPGTLPGSGNSTPRRQQFQSAAGYSFPSNPSSPSQRDFTYNEYEPSTPLPSVGPLRRKHHTPDRASPTPSRTEWQEGPSRIAPDSAEDRIPSTSFITNLISSTSDNNHRGHVHRNKPSSSHLTSDGMSAISEMTYPPPPGAFRTPPPGSDSASRTSPSKFSNKPPSTFLTLDDDQSAVGSTTTAGSYGVSVIRTASMTKKLEPRGLGASVVGYTSGTIKRVASTSKSPTSNTRRVERRVSSPVPDDEPDVQRITMPDYHAGSDSTAFSPARRSSIGFRPGDTLSSPTSATRQSRGTSFFSSLTSRFGSDKQQSLSGKNGLSGWFAARHLGGASSYQNMSSVDGAARKKEEEALPLPTLMSRAGALEGMLARGHHPHQSVVTSASRDPYGRPLMTQLDSKYREDMQGDTTLSYRAPSSGAPTTPGPWPGPPNGDAAQPRRLTRRKKAIAIVGSSILLVALVLGIGLGLGLPKKHTSPRCSVGLAGNSCTLNSTCVCTSTLPGQCDALAQNLISLIPTLNELFVANYTPNSLSDAVWAAQGAPPVGQCEYQAVVVDVAPTLDVIISPNRTMWAQTALLWNLAQSQNTAALQSMQEFLADAPWGDLSQVDGPVADASSQFTMSSMGFKFDFAAQTVTAPSVNFASNGNPSSAQAAQVGSVASSALDRMYSFALASSTQRQQPLQSYWTGALGQNANDLPTFSSYISASPILLPFDATASAGNFAVSSLLTNSTSSPFPMPLACYPKLNDTQLQLLNDVESTVYGLTPSSVVNEVDTSCFADRPVYGVLDVLHLRQPFVDSRTGIAKQAAVLQSDVAPRAIIHSGETLSALPGVPVNSIMTGVQILDPRQYGTTNHLNHILLNYLTSIPDITVAIALVEFVLSASSVPPSNGTTLYNALASIPALEVAIFGTMVPPDISHVVSSLSTPSGNLFFGSDQSLALRDWAINGANSSVQWSEYSISSEAVHDTSFSSSIFNSVWLPAYEWFHITTTQMVNVGTIVDAFQATGQFAA